MADGGDNFLGPEDEDYTFANRIVRQLNGETHIYVDGKLARVLKRGEPLPDSIEEALDEKDSGDEGPTREERPMPAKRKPAPVGLAAWTKQPKK